jgi:ribosomal protein S4E
MKEKKANERSNRIVVKGRKVMTHGQINKGPEKKENLVKVSNETDEKYMLDYDDA